MKANCTKPMRSLFIGMITFGAVAIALYTVWIFTQQYLPEVESVISSGILISLTFTAAVIGLLIASNKKTATSLRRAWLLMGLAALCNAIAESLWIWYEVVLEVDPFPSFADVFYLLFYPLTLAGILYLPYVPIQQERRAILGLDMGIVMIMGAIFLWYFILAPILEFVSGGLAGVIALAYPIGDLFILAGFLSLVQRDVENINRTVLYLLSCSMLSTAIADICFAFLETHSIPYIMAPLNILWMISYWTMLTAAAWQVVHPVSDSSIESFRPLLRNTLIYLVPILSMVFTFSISLNLLRSDMSLYWTLIGCFTIFALVLFRQYIVLRDNRRLYKQMEQQAVTDSLTGLYNRHFFNEALQREIKRADRYGYPLTILMMDVDNFKAYNDLHGHLKGDVLLKEIAAQIKSHVRASDLLARFGGDEFVLILPETDINQAQAIIKKLDAAVSETFSRDRLGISIGSALLQPDMTPQSLLAEADRSLYRIKPTK